MLEEGPYTQLEHRKDKLLNLGYDYKDTLLTKTMSNRMFSSSTTVTEFLKYINDIMVYLVDRVKYIKIHANPALDKYQKTLN